MTFLVENLLRTAVSSGRTESAWAELVSCSSKGKVSLDVIDVKEKSRLHLQKTSKTLRPRPGRLLEATGQKHDQPPKNWGTPILNSKIHNKTMWKTQEKCKQAAVNELSFAPSTHLQGSFCRISGTSLKIGLAHGLAARTRLLYFSDWTVARYFS